MAQASLHAAIQPQVGDRGQQGLQQVVLYDVQHALKLAEDQHTVLGDHRLCTALRRTATTQAAIQQQLEDIEREKTFKCQNYTFIPHYC